MKLNSVIDNRKLNAFSFFDNVKRVDLVTCLRPFLNLFLRLQELLLDFLEVGFNLFDETELGLVVPGFARDSREIKQGGAGSRVSVCLANFASEKLCFVHHFNVYMITHYN